MRLAIKSTNFYLAHNIIIIRKNWIFFVEDWLTYRKALPIWAAAKGSLPLFNSNSRLKLTKIPWAVSGRRNLQNFKLKSTITQWTPINWVCTVNICSDNYNDDVMGCLPWYVSIGPSACPKHEVKVQKWRKVIASERSLYTVLTNNSPRSSRE